MWIRRHGNSVVLGPIATDWAWLDSIVGKLSEDFLAHGRAQPALQERPELDSLFE